MLRISPVLMAALLFSEICFAQESIISPSETKESVCRVIVAELYKFGKSAEPSIDLLMPKSGKSKQIAFLKYELIKSIEAASSIYKNLDCNKVLEQK